MGMKKGLPYGLLGDTDAKDWKAALGVSKSIYEQEIADSYAELAKTGKPFDRDDIQRDTFNAMVPPDKYGDPKALEAFYTSELFSKLLVYEAPENDLLQSIIQSGIQAATQEGEPLGVALQWLRQEFGEEICAIDNGFGSGYLGLGISAQMPKAHVRMLDFPTPPRVVLAKALEKYWPGHDVKIEKVGDPTNALLLSESSVHFIISHEVLEHTADPIAELAVMRRALVKGGLLWLSTFFNSCEGKNPSHLTSHDHFQDCDLWFSEVRKAGFAHFYADPRGVPKLFVAV